MSAAIQDWGCDGVLDLFTHMSGGYELSLPEHVKISIGSASMTISNSDPRFSIAVDHLGLNDYTSLSASVVVSANGVVVRGETENIDFPDTGIKLVNVFIQAAFEKVDSGRETDATLGGTVQLTGVDNFPTISAVLYFSKVQGGHSNWALAGHFSNIGNESSLGELFNGFKGTFLQDLSLQELAFFASTYDDPKMNNENIQGFPIHKGWLGYPSQHSI